MKRVYIAGPVTGVPDLNRAAFLEAARAVEAAGHEAVVPHDHVPSTATHEEAMRICLPLLLGCDYIALIGSWYYSDGARIECDVAAACGIPRLEVSRRDTISFRL